MSLQKGLRAVIEFYIVSGMCGLLMGICIYLTHQLKEATRVMKLASENSDTFYKEMCSLQGTQFTALSNPLSIVGKEIPNDRKPAPTVVTNIVLDKDSFIDDVLPSAVRESFKEQENKND